MYKPKQGFVAYNVMLPLEGEPEQLPLASQNIIT